MITKEILVMVQLMLVPIVVTSQVNSASFRFVLSTMLSNNVPTITIKSAANSFNNYLFLDAREKEEFVVSHLPNALFAGYKNFNAGVVLNVPLDKPIVVYCSIGKRSEDITTKLKKQGFKNVYNLYGGIFEWINQGYQVYDMQNKPTDKVHAYSRIWGRFLQKGVKVYN